MPDDTYVQVFADDSRISVLAAYTDHLEDLVAVYRDAAAGDGDLLDRQPAPGAWSVAQVVHHLADYELAHSDSCAASSPRTRPDSGPGTRTGTRRHCCTKSARRRTHRP